MSSFRLTPLEPATNYITSSEFIDFEDPQVARLHMSLASKATSLEGYAQHAFVWVRDNIRHSYDYEDEIVSISASETLRNKTGLCYAKAHLLAALLRSNGIAAGMCYQKLSEGSSYVVHGQVALKLNEKWIRVDPRGNKLGINAQFSTTEEQLAWTVNLQAGELDYPEIFSEPASQIIEVLQEARTVSSAVLPQDLKIQ